MAVTLGRRVAELEARVVELELERFNGEMPPRPEIGVEPVDVQSLWRTASAETVVAYDPGEEDVDVDWRSRMYL